MNLLCSASTSATNPQESVGNEKTDHTRHTLHRAGDLAKRHAIEAIGAEDGMASRGRSIRVHVGHRAEARAADSADILALGLERLLLVAETGLALHEYRDAGHVSIVISRTGERAHDLFGVGGELRVDVLEVPDVLVVVEPGNKSG